MLNRKPALAVIALVILFNTVGCGVVAVSKSKYEEKDIELKKTGEQLAELKTKHAEEKKENKETVAALETQISKLTAQKEELEDQIATATKKLLVLIEAKEVLKKRYEKKVAATEGKYDRTRKKLHEMTDEYEALRIKEEEEQMKILEIKKDLTQKKQKYLLMQRQKEALEGVVKAIKGLVNDY